MVTQGVNRERRGPGRSPARAALSHFQRNRGLGSRAKTDCLRRVSSAFSDLDFSRKPKVAVETSRRGGPPRSPAKNYIAADSVIPTVTGRWGVIWRPLLWLKGLPKAKVSLNESSGLFT